MKVTTRLVLIGLLAFSILLLPIKTHAQDAKTRSDQYCSQVKSRKSEIISKFEERTLKYNEAIQNQTKNLEAKRNEQNEKNSTLQAKADLKRSESLGLLQARQPSDELKLRANEFAEAVDQAVMSRRLAYSQARNEFRIGIDNLLVARNQSVQSASQQFKNIAETTVVQSEKLCGRNESAKNRSDTIAALKQARLEYAKSMRSRSDFSKSVRELVKVRKEKFKAINTAFEQTMQEIRSNYSDLTQN